MTVNDAVEFDPFAAEMATDPHSFYHRMRRSCPVFLSSMSSDMWMVSDDASQVFVVTTYEDLAFVLEHPELFPSGNKTGPEDPPEVQAELARGLPKATTLYESDQPGHTRLRSLIQSAWTPGRIARWEPRIREAARELVEELAPRGSAELVEDYADRLMNTAILDFMGIPREDHERIKHWDKLWVKVFIPGHPLEDQRSAAAEIVTYQRYLEDLFEERRNNPRDDLASALVHARTEDGDALTMPELVWGLMELYGAGYGNTTEGLSNILNLLLERRELWEDLLADPSAVEHAVEEGLRLDGPVQWLSREAAADVELSGTKIPKGSTVMVSYVAANRDPKDFPEPDEFRIQRRGVTTTGARHVAHGRGIHYCVGAGWSRTAIRIGLEALLQRIPDLRLQDGFQAEYHLPAPMIRCVQALPAVWSPQK
ncbi:cytochrome P450 [Saccharopolyspora shandongensis]|uniref:cytochrome P450 n=1 Tax=Saccharopolyspora shandongensis TaxID=418495 RepID=UPI00343EB3BC